MKKKRHVFYIVSAVFLSLCLLLFSVDSVKIYSAGLSPFSKKLDPFKQNKLIGRGVNYGNALEFPGKSSWVETLEIDYARMIKDIGFDSVRIPYR